jgi:transcriptional regulator with XRE-family HTH domain
MEDPGQKLKKIRERLNLKYREVEEASTRIADVRGNDEFVVALSRLADIENKGTLPSLYRLYSICAIYRLDMVEVMGWYGVSLDTLAADSALAQLPRTHPIRFQVDEGEVQVPLTLDPGIDLSKTLFLSRLVQRWGRLPLMLLKNIDLKSYRYGFIGTEDWSMFPLIPPGSLIVIDETRRRIQNTGWTSEFERPIYFFEHRNGYACGWCSLKDGKLTIIPHPSSQVEPEVFDHPAEIEVVGQVTGIAMTLDPVERRRKPNFP